MIEKNNQSDQIFQLGRPWNNNENSVWIASTISLHRNIEKFKFPAKLEPDRQKQIVSLVSKEMVNCSSLNKARLIRAEDTSSLQKQYLSEHFLTIQGFQQLHSGEAFVLDETGEFLATINVNDHINMQLIDCKGELENTWNKLVEIETFLGKAVSYSFSQKFGFLTSDFNQCGTALIASTFLQVPALVHVGKLETALNKLIDDSLFITGIQGNPSELIGDLLVIRNKYTLGNTEENIISNLRSFTTKLILEENSIRNHLKHGDETQISEMKDKISRAYAILIHSYQIEVVEALNTISLLKLGLELGWLSGISMSEINRLFLYSRRAHLLHQYHEEIKQEEIPHKRAEFIHSFLKNVQLKI